MRQNFFYYFLLWTIIELLSLKEIFSVFIWNEWEYWLLSKIRDRKETPTSVGLYCWIFWIDHKIWKREFNWSVFEIPSKSHLFNSRIQKYGKNIAICSHGLKFTLLGSSEIIYHPAQENVNVCIYEVPSVILIKLSLKKNMKNLRKLINKLMWEPFYSHFIELIKLIQVLKLKMILNQPDAFFPNETMERIVKYSIEKFK